MVRVSSEIRSEAVFHRRLRPDDERLPLQRGLAQPLAGRVKAVHVDVTDDPLVRLSTRRGRAIVGQITPVHWAFK